MERVFKNKGLLVKLLTGGLSTILLIAVLWLGTTLYFLGRAAARTRSVLMPT